VWLRARPTRDEIIAAPGMAHRTGLCPGLRTEVMLVPLTGHRPVAPGQDWLKDAGSGPAALLDGNGNGNVEPVR